MPIKEFCCEDCKHTFERFFKSFSDFEDEATYPGIYCPKCDGYTEVLVSKTAPPKFEGSGFYETDYKGK